MFDSVLVANRGEIAVRIMRTLRALGIRSVAVYSDADAHARHVVEADHAIRLGRAAASESYLSIERVIDATLSSGAQALHPGYGFLAENAALATACADAGVVFVGPPPSVIASMGDKIRAKEMVSARGVRVVPGIDATGLSDVELARQAQAIGFPLLIKPSAGGGGKGMRTVSSADALLSEVATAKREALGAFGDDTLLLERFIPNPRHIEVQVLADSFGNVVHIGERECSLQRRHQKVIEEAPSPALTAADRDAIGQQAVAAALACGYVNAGTVEFIVAGDRPDETFFIEMNTRLQVEHPVTELVWGVDLVELQLRIADGETLPFKQEDLQPKGHAMEGRVYAEDPHRGFLPTGGRVVALLEPTHVAHVRVDSSLLPGAEVGSTYDPMLSKVIAWGVDRDAARRTLDAALGETTILGLTTNIGFLREVLADADVIAGNLDTELLGRLEARAPARTTPRIVEVAAALVDQTAMPSVARPPWNDVGGWRIGDRSWTTWHGVDGEGTARSIRVRGSSNGTFEVLQTGGQNTIARIETHADRAQVTFGDQTESFVVARAGRTLWLGCEGRTWSFTQPESQAPDALAHAGDAMVVSPMPGTVVAVLVTSGESISTGQPIAVVEAMKMEHTLRATVDGVVTEVLAKVGDQVTMSQVIAVIEQAPAAEEA